MKFFKVLGPGIVVAATGVGAGDLIASSVAGAKYGVVIIWAAFIGAGIKFFLNEGIARWQMATGTTVLQGWRQKFQNAVLVYFMVYLVIWGFIVGGALIAACGLAAHAIMPFFSVKIWGIIHSVSALLLVFIGRYMLVEKLMKLIIGLMFVVVCVSAVLIDPDWASILKSLVTPRLPKGSAKFVLGVIGGVGGSVTLLSYGYWIQEKGWKDKTFTRRVRADLIVAYTLTGLFGIAIMIISAGVQPEIITGGEMVIGLADKLGLTVGSVGKWIFLIGFWGAVFSSMVGVWQGIPYLFSDAVSLITKKRFAMSEKPPDVRSSNYLLFLLYLAIPPMGLLFLERPIWVVIIYTITGAFFMPFLATLLLIMNNRKTWVGNFKNNFFINMVLSIALIVFAYLCVKEILEIFTTTTQ